VTVSVSSIPVQEGKNGVARIAVAPKVTVLVTLYDAARDVTELVEMILAQRHPDYEEQGDWLRAVFIDDCSRDATLRVLEEALAARANPAQVRVQANSRNLGLAASLNGALRECDTEYVLTCQCDCRFGSQTYVADMLALLARWPDAAAITGQPTSNQPIPLKEKINLVENIQDILPREQAAHVHEVRELIYTGFAEGRADGFRLKAMQSAGYYDTTLRISGEDQVLSGRLRELGYNVYQAPNLAYVMSLSSQQDSIGGMLRKQYIWGKTHPYILLRARETLSGVIGKKAGSNRRLRVLLRTSQVAATLAYLALPAAFLLSSPEMGFGILAGLVLMKGLIFQKHVRRVGMSISLLALFAALQPAFDLCYTFGLARGLIALASKAPGENI
jgi:GT2 family glycosyltransferase